MLEGFDGGGGEEEGGDGGEDAVEVGGTAEGEEFGEGDVEAISLGSLPAETKCATILPLSNFPNHRRANFQLSRKSENHATVHNSTPNTQFRNCFVDPNQNANVQIPYELTASVYWLLY